MEKKQPFWEQIPMKELSTEQWESLCDGCCQCCAHKLEDEETGEVFKTNVVCQYLDTESLNCTVYENRHEYVPDCIKVTPTNASQLSWMPDSCGYKRLASDQPLPRWHPLKSGRRQSVESAGKSVKGKVISEADIDMDNIEDYIVDDDYFD